MKRFIAIASLAAACVLTSSFSGAIMAADQPVVIGSDRNTGGPTAADKQAMDNIKSGFEKLKQEHPAK
jgi:hypothetical protein